MQGHAKQRLCQNTKPLIFKGFTQGRLFWSEKDAGIAKTKLPPTGKHEQMDWDLDRLRNEIVDMEKAESGDRCCRAFVRGVDAATPNDYPKNSSEDRSAQ
jgi:hypothetical protein